MKTSAATPLSLPEQRPAGEPPEARGIKRDEVRLLVVGPGGFEHVIFRDVGRFLAPGDLLVVNTSRTVPAAVDAERDGQEIVVHFSARLNDGSWTVELRAVDGSRPLLDGAGGEVIETAGGGRFEILGAYLGIEGRSRMQRVDVRVSDGSVEHYLARVGRPISYSHVSERWPLSMYQTVFARVPGSAEMPSAGRPFTHELVTQLVSRGLVLAPVVLHAGVSSLEAGETPLPERYRVPASTARLVNHTREAGGRIVAVGTTVTRALESAADGDVVRPSEGWTDLVLDSERPSRVVDGLVTGWHAPDASHRWLLEAVAGRASVDGAYAAASEAGYLWHEFGDSCLLLPRRSRTDAEA
ncbi:MAG: S-adenosylmethionine:tRNA ribosyltransferase-isomerase [Actinobacteria bacterium]|nr:S-adenosylmethionine:tRNA ribosyltransferase-isomerase [Actinomycetota bacterium]